MRLSAARALLSVLILVVLGETTAGATPDEWLREWLRKLAVKIPPQTVRSTFVSVTLSDLTCTGFAVGTVSSELGARERGERGSCRSRSRMRVLGNVDHRLRPLDGGGARVFLGWRRARARGSGAGRGRSGRCEGAFPRSCRDQRRTSRSHSAPPATVLPSWTVRVSPSSPPLPAWRRAKPTSRSPACLSRARGRRRSRPSRLCSVLCYAGQRALRSVVQITGALGHLSVIQVDEGGDAVLEPLMIPPMPIPAPEPDPNFYDWRQSQLASIAEFVVASFAAGDGDASTGQFGRWGPNSLVRRITGDGAPGRWDVSDERITSLLSYSFDAGKGIEAGRREDDG